MDKICLALLLAVQVASALAITALDPQQIHLSWNGNEGEMTAVWSTMEKPNGDDPTFVNFGAEKNNLKQKVSGSSKIFTDGGEAKHSQYIHVVTMTKLSPNKTYYYDVGSSSNRSPVFQFRALPRQADWLPRLAVIGDMGTKNYQSLAQLQKEVESGMYDMIIHNGDFAYDMDTDNGENGDTFMRLIQDVATRVPYETTVGNHEQAYNFSHYTNRFKMPGSAQSLFYSIDLGPVHFIAIDTEFYFFPQYGIDQIFNQYRWLEADLKAARERGNQWIIVSGHRPLYCSNPDPTDCNPFGSIIREGVPILNIPGVEQLFRKYGVDLYFGSHEHSYERLWPVHAGKTMNGTTDPSNPYYDPLATAHIITGAGGNPEYQVGFRKKPFDFSAFRTKDYGYARVFVKSSTSMKVEEVGIVAPKKGVQGVHGVYKGVIDSIDLEKSQNTPAWLR